jgi:hypothetical protein
LIADLAEKYSRLLFRGPDFHKNAQTLYLTVGGDLGGTYQVKLYLVARSDSGSSSQDIDIATAAGIYMADASHPLVIPYFGVSQTGSWEAWFEVTGLSGRKALSNHVYWSVGFPEVHGVP